MKIKMIILASVCLASAFVPQLSAQSLSKAQEGDLYNKFFQVERRLQAIEQKVYGGGATGASGTTSADIELRVQEIENESSTLYGAVEQLGNAVERLAGRVETLAKDLEFRLQDIERAQNNAAVIQRETGGATANRGGDTIESLARGDASPRAIDAKQALKTPSDLVVPKDSAPEQLYKDAYDSVTAADYPKAQRWFETFLERHPKHELADNAYYWLGEVYLVQGNARKAVLAFKNGLEAFPKGRKAPGNLLKMGTAFEQLGQKGFASSAWKRVLDEYPDSPEAARAEGLLQPKGDA